MVEIHIMATDTLITSGAKSSVSPMIPNIFAWNDGNGSLIKGSYAKLITIQEQHMDLV